MALQINPNIGSPAVGGDANAKPPTSPNGVPNQDAANQLAALLKTPTQEGSGAISNPLPSGSPFNPKPTDNPTSGGATPNTLSDTKSGAASGSNSPTATSQGGATLPQSGSQVAPDNPTSGGATLLGATPNTLSDTKSDAAAGSNSPTVTSQGGATLPQSGSQVAPDNQTSGGATLLGATPNTLSDSKPGAATGSNSPAATSQGGATLFQSGSQVAPDALASGAPNTSSGGSPSLASGSTAKVLNAGLPQNSNSDLSPNPGVIVDAQKGVLAMSNTSIGEAPGINISADLLGEVKPSTKSTMGPGSLSDAQLSAAASMNAAVGMQPSPSGTVASGVEEVVKPHVDGEKIEAMMKSVTKELGMRDLSQLKLGGEMTLKLDQGALPNTEVKVRFDGDEMVISIDSKTADVNQFCTDNLALLQQSVSSGMKDEMKVRIEVRNPPEQPNQRKEGQSGGGQSGQGSQGGSSGQESENSQGDSLDN